MNSEILFIGGGSDGKRFKVPDFLLNVCSLNNEDKKEYYYKASILDHEVFIHERLTKGQVMGMLIEKYERH